jgi:hypothetical protein
MSSSGSAFFFSFAIGRPRLRNAAAALHRAAVRQAEAMAGMVNRCFPQGGTWEEFAE